MKNVYKIKQEKVFQYKEYEIFKVTDYFGNWEYVLMYKNWFRKRSFDFTYLKNLALEDKPYKLN